MFHCFISNRDHDKQGVEDCFPVHWSSVSSKDFSLLPVSATLKQQIEQNFNLTMRARMRYQIISIEEVCNKQLYQKYAM